TEAHRLHDVCQVLVEVESVLVRGMPAPGHHMLGGAPNEVGRAAVRVEDVGIGAVAVDRERAGRPAAAVRPAVQEPEARTVGVNEQMVKPMPGLVAELPSLAPVVGNVGSLAEAEDEFTLAGR